MAEMKEIEIRVKVSNAEKKGVENRLKALNAKLIESTIETSHYIDLPGEKIMKKGGVLRVKILEGHALLTFKGKQESKNFNVREEIQTPVSEPKMLLRILKAAGLIETFKYSKERNKYELKGVHEVNLDKLPKHGWFVEVEANSISQVKEMLKILGLGKKKLITNSYAKIIRTGRY